MPGIIPASTAGNICGFNDLHFQVAGPSECSGTLGIDIQGDDNQEKNNGYQDAIHYALGHKHIAKPEGHGCQHQGFAQMPEFPGYHQYGL